MDDLGLQQDISQEKAFRAFVNAKFKQSDQYDVVLEHLNCDEMHSGTILLKLIHVLEGKSIVKTIKTSKLKFVQLENINTVLKFLENEKKIKLVNIRPQQIQEGQLKYILALMWHIILFYQISATISGDDDESAKRNSMSQAEATKELLNWVNTNTGGESKDFTSSFSDGTALRSLIKSVVHDDDEIETKLNGDPGVLLNKQCVEYADENLAIPIMIEPEELSSGPNKLAMMTYLSFFKDYQQRTSVEADKLKKERDAQREAREKERELRIKEQEEAAQREQEAEAEQAKLREEAANHERELANKYRQELEALQHELENERKRSQNLETNLAKETERVGVLQDANSKNKVMLCDQLKLIERMMEEVKKQSAIKPIKDQVKELEEKYQDKIDELQKALDDAHGQIDEQKGTINNFVEKISEFKNEYGTKSIKEGVLPEKQPEQPLRKRVINRDPKTLAEYKAMTIPKSLWEIENPYVYVWKIDKNMTDFVDVISGKNFGTFDNHGCYVILDAKNRKKMKLHLWIGSAAPEVDRYIVTAKGNELERVLGKLKPGKLYYQQSCFETEAFKRLFQRFFIVGTSESVNVDGMRLLWIKGFEHNIRVVEVPLSGKSLNHGDVFILASTDSLMLWVGESASKAEISMGHDIIQHLNEQRGMSANIETIKDGKETDSFWDPLGGPCKVKSAAAGGLDATTEVNILKLWKLSDADGQLDFTLIDEAAKIPLERLSSSDIFILDTGIEIFIWIGHLASEHEKSMSLIYAQQYIYDYDLSSKTPITRVLEYDESPYFMRHFDITN